MIEYIIILILIVILFLSLRKTNITHFQTMEDALKCKYVPWGPNFDFCVDNCQSSSRVGLWDETGNSCTNDICESKCLNCDNIEMCEWLDVIKLEAKKKLNKLTLPKDSDVSKLLPKKLLIEGISYGNVVTLSWTNNKDADKFIIHYYDLTKYSNKINIIKVNSNNQDIMTHNINILKPNTNYNFIIYGLNKYGISDASNNINLKT